MFSVRLSLPFGLALRLIVFAQLILCAFLIESRYAYSVPNQDFIDSPSRYLYRYNSFYNGYANAPTCTFNRPCLISSLLDKISFDCVDSSVSSYLSVNVDVLSLGLTNDYANYIKLSCQDNFMFTSHVHAFDVQFFENVSLSDAFSSVGFIDDSHSNFSFGQY